MTEKDLKKLSRVDLLQMLIAQSEELQAVKEKLQQAELQLANRDIAISNVGSLAEACLALNGVFDAAQAACAQYTENMKKTESLCRQMEYETRAKCDAMLESARTGVQTYWTQITRTLTVYAVLHPELKELLQKSLPYPLPTDQEEVYETNATDEHPGDRSAES